VALDDALYARYHARRWLLHDWVQHNHAPEGGITWAAGALRDGLPQQLVIETPKFDMLSEIVSLGLRVSNCGHCFM
jgi:hypothetical protein